MRRPAWGGRPPSSDAEAREFILEAAKRVVLRDGLDKANVASVAREVGITRQTFYRHFSDSDEVLRNAEVRAGGGLFEALMRHTLAHETLEDRLIEALRFLAREVPKDPLLSQHFAADRASHLLDAPALAYSTQFLLAIWPKDRPRPSARRARDLSELMLRWVHSLVVLPRSPRQLGDLLTGSVRPAIEGWLRANAR